jgi:hypothetical protein
MDLWARGKRAIFTKIVKIITATPTSPPGIIETKKAKALSSGSYKIVFQILLNIKSFYPEEEILAKLILTNLYVPFAMDDNEKYALHPNKHPLVHHILKWLVLYIENK